MSLPVTDDFNRIDSAGLGANWTDRINGFNVTSLAAQSTATANCVSIWTADAFGNDHQSTATIIDYNTRYAGVVARFTTSSTANGYAWLTDPTGVLIGYRCDGGSFTPIFTPGTSVSNGDVVMLSCSGTTQSYFKNNLVTPIGTTTDTTYSTGGAAGLYGNGNLCRLGPWTGANAGAGPTFLAAPFKTPRQAVNRAGTY